MKMKELKEKSQADLQKMLASNREKLRDMRFRVSLGQMKDVREIRDTRKIISRILTLMRQTTK